ncbi:hypothetical protein D3C80_2173990 [compost metagenome]
MQAVLFNRIAGHQPQALVRAMEVILGQITDIGAKGVLVQDRQVVEVHVGIKGQLPVRAGQHALVVELPAIQLEPFQ